MAQGNTRTAIRNPGAIDNPAKGKWPVSASTPEGSGTKQEDSGHGNRVLPSVACPLRAASTNPYSSPPIPQSQAASACQNTVLTAADLLENLKGRTDMDTNPRSLSDGQGHHGPESIRNAARPLCRDYMNGRCSAGKDCSRYHPLTRNYPRKVTTPDYLGSLPSKSEQLQEPTNICYTDRFDKIHLISVVQYPHNQHHSERCPDGQNTPPQGDGTAPKIPVPNRPSAKHDQECIYFKRGTCTWGDQCRRRHVLSERDLATDSQATSSPSSSWTQSRAASIPAAQNEHETRHLPQSQPVANGVSASAAPPLPSSLPRRPTSSETQFKQHTNSVLELDEAMLKKIDDNRPSRKINEICRDYQKGVCRWRDRCRHIHVHLKDGISVPSNLETTTLSRAPTSEVSTGGGWAPKYPSQNQALRSKRAEPQSSDKNHLTDQPPHHASGNAATTLESESLAPPDGKTEPGICPAFQNGTCPQGRRCRLLHKRVTSERSVTVQSVPASTQPSSRSSPHVPASSSDDVQPPQQKAPSHVQKEICRNYMENRCGKGALCRYFHPPRDNSHPAPTPTVAESSRNSTPRKQAPSSRDRPSRSSSEVSKEDKSTSPSAGKAINVPPEHRRSGKVETVEGTSKHAGPGDKSKSHDRSSILRAPDQSKDGKNSDRKQTTAAADTPNRQANTDAQSERPGSMEVITEGRSNASSDGKVARPTKGHRFEQRRPPQSRSAPPPSSGKDGSENSNDGVGFKTAAGPPSREVEGSASDTTYHSFSTSSSQASPHTSNTSLTLPHEEDHADICLDFLRGRCFRNHCKYSHREGEPPKRSEGANARNQSQKADEHNITRRNHDKDTGRPLNRLVEMLEQSTTRGLRRSEDPKCSGRISGVCNDKHKEGQMRAPESSCLKSNSNVPLVPPGLGLEKISDTAAPNAHKAPLETMNLTVLDSTKVTFGPGFEVQRLVTGFESRQVLVKNLPCHVTPADITATLEPFGEVVTVQMTEQTKTNGTAVTARVTFTNHDDASRAASALNGGCIFDSTVSVQLASFKSTSLGKGTLHDGDVFLEFASPHKTGFAGYPTEALANKAVANASGVDLRGFLVTAELYEGIPTVGSYNVRFRGLPPDAQARDLEMFGKNEGCMLERPKYQSLQGALKGLRNLVEGFGELITFNVLPPPYKRGLVRAWAHFAKSSVAANFCKSLHGKRQRFFGDNRLFARHVKTLTYALPSDVFDTLASDVHLLRSYICDKETGSSLSVQDRRPGLGAAVPVTIKLASEDMKSLIKVKAAFERLLKGERIKQDGEIIWDGFFSRRAGIMYLDDLEHNNPGVMINRDPRRRTLSVFGPASKRLIVQSAILAKVASLRSQRLRSIPLGGRLIGLFMSSDLAKLQRQYGNENVFIDLRSRVLKVRGDEDIYKSAQLAVLHARQRHVGERHRHEVECPVCFDEVSSPVTLECGHSWCQSCLSNYLIAAVDNKVFPLTCLGDEATCTQSIPLATAQELLSTNDFEAVIQASFTAYVQSRPSEFHYCPTPDCPQIYRTGRSDTVLQCPSCLTRICPNCHVEYHEDVSCPDPEKDDKLFEEWKKSHDVKNCPSCKVPIERAAGCNHMTCVRCKTHICWSCLATFTTGEDVYDHMRMMHGGIGLL
ncbi:hypothetical protein AcW1_001614 [Taiwanofungus camphoratus]|nr:hypothetical protein AcW1_001614 [Antrodia cinnamomea]